MLPSPSDLRELALRFRQAAEKLPGADAKIRIARHAFLLAQVAEQLERESALVAFVQNANIERYGRLLAGALDERTRTTVAELLASEQEHIHRKTEEIRAWRLRSEELRTVADTCLVPSAQGMLRRAADNYDRLADQAERRLGGLGPFSRHEVA